MFVLKIGGDTSINIDYIAKDLKNILSSGEKCIVVHGAHTQRDNLCEKLGIAIKTIKSPSGIESRYTDQEMMDATIMAYAGLVNSQIVSKFREFEIDAIGLSGLDGGLIIAERKSKVLSVENGKTKVIRDNLTGKVISVNKNLLKMLLKSRYTPIISIPATTKSGQVLNVDNDRITTLLAKELGADKIVSLFSEAGFLKNLNNPRSVVKNINLSQIKKYEEKAQGRMKHKVLSAVEAIEAGVPSVLWGDGRVKNPITKTFNGRGTIITK